MKQYSLSDLKTFLRQAEQRYHAKSYLSSDPLEYVHRYTDPLDQEAVALVAALLAYGNVKQIRRSVEDILTRIHAHAASPSRFVIDLRNDHRSAKNVMKGFVHRFNVGKDIHTLLELLSQSWKTHGSLGAHFLSYLDPNESDFGNALNALIADWRKWAGKKNTSTFSYLLTAPKDGSCCKRWCMFLRWMGRKDQLDPGLWCEKSLLSHTFPDGRWLRTRQLVIPLDTHTGRISQKLGLTRRKSLNWRAALEVTESLRAFDSKDPTRYDFALSRIGIVRGS